jgi:uncharacterized membrane protein YeaQ/YmgE (transglycosylase-associated protein family)
MTLPPSVEAISEDWLLYVTSGLTVAGVLNILVPKKSFGIIPECLTGLAGSLAGGALAWAWNDYFRPGGFAFILSSFGALVFISVLRKFKK